MNIINILSDVPISTVFLSLLILSTWYYFFFKRFNSSTVTNAPTILTSMGIFGTFIGVAIGLFYFDPTDVGGSVPQLINGLKTAFWSSILGIALALTIKIKHQVIVHKKNGNGISHAATVDDIVDKLSEINKALVGNEESTLVTQIKLARQDSNDKLDMLRNSMDNYLMEMAKSNSEALIEALREVIKDFNAKINEQFGENFKHLNEAVGKILDWQEKYRMQMEEMINQQKTTCENMSLATERYEKLVNNTERFTETAQHLTSILNGLESQRIHLQESLQHLATLIESARTGLPDIEKKIEQLVGEVTSGLKTGAEAMQESMRNINGEFNQHVKELTDKTHDQVAELDNALTDELTKSLQLFGQQLASLSEKFVSDYSPLTDKLREVVSLARGVA